MARRLKVVVAYNGTPFAGWQSQTGGNTVQDHLENAVASVGGERIRVHGAGRTDAGVHALAQTAHFDVSASQLPAERWPDALNASLPPTIRVVRAAQVTQSFHARFSAKGKVYRYRIWNDRILPPFELGRAWHFGATLDFDLLASVAQEFCGQHDFASFSANRGKPDENTIRTIGAVKVRRKGCLITVEVSGDGFLYRMVRLMVGALVRSGAGRGAPGEISARLRGHPLAPTGARSVAPAEGLFLVRVRY